MAEEDVAATLAYGSREWQRTRHETTTEPLNSYVGVHSSDTRELKRKESGRTAGGDRITERGPRELVRMDSYC